MTDMQTIMYVHDSHIFVHILTCIHKTQSNMHVTVLFFYIHVSYIQQQCDKLAQL